MNKKYRDIIFHPLVEFKLKYAEYLVKIYKVAKIKPKTKLLNETGEYFYNKGRYDKAIEEFKNALKDGPHFIIYYNLGQGYEKKGFRKEALEMYKKVIELQPNYKIAQNRLNIIWQEKIVKQNSGNALAWEKLGIYYLENYNYSMAIDIFEEALKLSPNLPLTHYNLGIAYINYGKYTNAIIELKKVSKLEPKVKYKVSHYIKVARKKEKEMLSYVLNF